MKIETRALEFPQEIKDKFERYLSRKRLEINYHNGHIVIFANTNVEIISLHKILLSSSEKEVIILYYGEHLYDDEIYFINSTKNYCNFHRLIELVTNYF